MPILLLTFLGKKRFYLLYFLEGFITLFAFADSYIYQDQGLHLYDKFVVQMLLNTNVNRELQLSFSTILVIFALFLFLIFLSKFIHYQLINYKNKKRVRILLLIPPMALSVLAINRDYFDKKGEVVNYLPLYTALRGNPGQEKLEIVQEIDIEKQRLVNKKVVFVMAESFRGDNFNETLMPKFKKRTEAKNCLVSERHYSGGHTTEYGVFTALYGVYGYHFENFKEKNKKADTLNIFKDSGYQLVGASASGLRGWNGSKFIVENFEKYKEFISKEIYKDDEDAIKFLLAEYRKNEGPGFYFLFLNSTHHNYYYPKNFEKFKPVMEQGYNHFVESSQKKKYAEKIFNRYKNSVTYIDANLAKMLDALDGNTIFVFTGDHAEEFWDEGLHGHGKTSYINARIKVPLIICGLSKKIKTKFTHHVDILPTVLQEMGAGRDIEKMFNGKTFFDERGGEKFAVVTGPLFPYGRNKLGFITDKYKFWAKKSSTNLHDFYVYRVTNHEDQNMVPEDKINEELQKLKKNYRKEVYRFLTRPTSSL